MEEEEEKEKGDKIAAKLAGEHACAVNGHEVCWVRNNGQHIPLERKDLSSWALWIVSYGHFHGIILTSYC